MEYTAKRALFWALTVFIVVLIILGFTLISFVSDAGTSQNTVSFTGEGKVSAVPDIAFLNFTVLTQADTSKNAQDDNSKKSDSVVDYLKDQGVDDKDIKTTSYNIYPRYGSRPVPQPLSEGLYYPYPGPTEPKIIGYEVQERFEVKIRDLDDASEIVDGVVEAGANQVTSFRFDIENADDLQAQAREMAVKDAREKAEELQDQVGIKLGKIVNFSEGVYGFPYYDRAYIAESGGGFGGGVPLPAFEPGENEILINVTITYQIK